MDAAAVRVAVASSIALACTASTRGRQPRRKLQGCGLAVGDRPPHAFTLGGSYGSRGAWAKGMVTRLRSAGAEAANSSDPDFPWFFRGRVRFRPAMVSTPQEAASAGVPLLKLFGLSVGGFVCLEYDESPVGPYFEVVQMAAAVVSERLWTAALWGSRLMVSDKDADTANRNVWGVPSEFRDIAFEAEGKPAVFADTDTGSLRIGDWGNMRFADPDAVTWGQLPIWWTPTLKALWAPLSLWRNEDKGGALPLRRLRLSASALRLRWAPAGAGGDAAVPALAGRSPDDTGDGGGGGEEMRIPLPFVIEADGVLIEIGKEFDRL